MGVHFNQAREKLEKWADDMVLFAEKALADIQEQIKALRRQARQAVTLEEQSQIQQQIQELEKQQRRQRQETFKAEDEIIEKRDSMIESLERRLARHPATESPFSIRWAVTARSVNRPACRRCRRSRRRCLARRRFRARRRSCRRTGRFRSGPGSGSAPHCGRRP